MSSLLLRKALALQLSKGNTSCPIANCCDATVNMANSALLIVIYFFGFHPTFSALGRASKLPLLSLNENVSIFYTLCKITTLYPYSKVGDIIF